MNATSHFLAAATLLAISISSADVTAQETMSAKELAARLSANITDGSAFIRLRMEVKGATGKTTFQLQVKERRTPAASDIMYQVLFPKERKGEAVLLQRRGGKTTGKIYTPAGGVQNIGSMKDSLFGSDLSYEDIIENFFAWNQQALAGTEEVGRTNCQILESKSGGGSSYSLVRSWIDARRLIPMRVEKYSGANLVRRIDTTRIAEDDTDRRIPASLAVQRPTKGTSTMIEGSSSKSNVAYTDADFSPQGMQNLAPPPSN